MLLSLRVLSNYIDPNTYWHDTQFRFTNGDSVLLTFQIIDLTKDTQFNPPGRRYEPLTGKTSRAFINGLNGDTVFLTASNNQITIGFLPPSSAAVWNSVPQPGDILTIPGGSVLVGAGNANVGNYTVLSATNSTVTAVKVPFSTLPVSVATATLSATADNDAIDYGVSSILQVQVGNVNTANILSRWAYQAAPQIDPSIWQMPIYPTDPIQGNADVYLTLNQQGAITSGIAKNALTVAPNPGNTNFAAVSPSVGTGAIFPFGQ